MSRICFDAALREHLQQNLARFDVCDIDDQTLRRAAVAIVVTVAEDLVTPCILLTRRAARMNRHSGQYALPGGKLDEGETTDIAALRELSEELGLDIDVGDILGELDDYPTRSGFRIKPVVVWVGADRVLEPAPEEVAKVHYIPFSELDSDALPVFEPGEDDGPPVLCSEFPTLGHRMYSPTASIMYQFREVAIRGNSTRVAHYDQPRFAWK